MIFPFDNSRWSAALDTRVNRLEGALLPRAFHQGIEAQPKLAPGHGWPGKRLQGELRMRYTANPVEVDAAVIVGVRQSPSDGRIVLTLDDGVNKQHEFIPDLAMMARMKPYPGDYVVTQADGYVYLNPKEVFERKYSKTPQNLAQSA